MYNYNVYTAMHQLGVTRLRTEQSKGSLLHSPEPRRSRAPLHRRRQIAPVPAPGSPRRAGTADPSFFLPARPAGGPGLRVEEEGRSRRPPQLEPQQAPPRSDSARLRAERRPAVPCPRAASQSKGSRGACLPRMCAALSWTRCTSCRRSTAVFARLTPKSARSSSRFAYRRKSLRSRQRRPLQTSAISHEACIWLNQKRFLFSVKRPNIKISVKEFNIRGKDNVKRRKRMQRLKMLDAVLRQHQPKNGATIVYCPTVNDVKRTTKYLRGEKYSAKAYYSELPKGRKKRVHRYFLTKKASDRRCDERIRSRHRPPGCPARRARRSAARHRCLCAGNRSSGPRRQKRRAPFCFLHPDGLRRRQPYHSSEQR